MREKDFQTRFTRWAHSYLKKTTAVELKVVNGSSLPFDAVKDHQVQNLMASKHGKIGYKIPDCGFDQKPYDFFIIADAEAYVGILFYEKRGDNSFYLIDVDTFLNEKKRSERKSLTRVRAGDLAGIQGKLSSK